MMIECRLAEDSVKTSPYGLSEAKRQMPIYHGSLFKFLILEFLVSWGKEHSRKKEIRKRNKKIKFFKRFLKIEFLKGILRGGDYIETSIEKLHNAFDLIKSDINQVLDETFGPERWDCCMKDTRLAITGYEIKVLHYQIFALPQSAAALCKFQNREEEKSHD